MSLRPLPCLRSCPSAQFGGVGTLTRRRRDRRRQPRGIADGKRCRFPSSPLSPVAAFAAASHSSGDRGGPAPAGPYSSFNPAATRVPRISRIDVPFAVICLADELYARMAESDVSSPEGAAACARALSQVLPPPPPLGGRGAAESPSGGPSSSLSRDVPFLSEREIVAVLRRLGRLGGPGAALAMRDFLEQTRRGYATGTRAIGAVLLHVAALNASPQAADDVRARMELDGVALDAECWNRLVYAKAKARDARAAMRATDEAFAAGVVIDVVTYAALMACLERDAGVLNSSTSAAASGEGGADAARRRRRPPPLSRSGCGRRRSPASISGVGCARRGSAETSSCTARSSARSAGRATQRGPWGSSASSTPRALLLLDCFFAFFFSLSSSSPLLLRILR